MSTLSITVQGPQGRVSYRQKFKGSKPLRTRIKAQGTPPREAVAHLAEALKALGDLDGMNAAREALTDA